MSCMRLAFHKYRSGKGSKCTARYHQRLPHNFSCWYVLLHQHGFHQSHTCQHGHALDSNHGCIGCGHLLKLLPGWWFQPQWYMHCWSSSTWCFKSETTIRKHLRCTPLILKLAKQHPLHEPLPHDGILMVEVRQSVKLAVSATARSWEGYPTARLIQSTRESIMSLTVLVRHPRSRKYEPRS